MGISRWFTQRMLLFLGVWLAAGSLLAGCGRPGMDSDLARAAATVAAQGTAEALTTPPFGATTEFSTDFSRHSVPYSEILPGGPERDGIPAIDQPAFVSIADANAWLTPVEPVALVQVGADVRAYPLQILTWHEIVNDTVGDLPLVITFCPLCNTAIAFERTLNGQVLDFGTTGRLRYSNMLMYDRQTETWWQQGSGEALVGELMGAQLTFYPAAIISWADFKAAYPAGQVLARETGYERNYGVNPYRNYDDITRTPYLYRGPATPDTLPAFARVLGAPDAGESVAYPFPLLEQVRVVNDTVGAIDLAVFWTPGTVSPIDGRTVAEGRAVGAARAFDRRLADQTLTFTFSDGQISDNETGSVWNAQGQALAGPLAGRALTPINGVNHFWFSWAAFYPATQVYQS